MDADGVAAGRHGHVGRAVGGRTCHAVGFESPLPDWCDVLVRDGDTAYRVRIALAGREEPLDFPSMYLRDMFAEGRHREHVAPEPTQGMRVVDLRGVL